MRFLTLNLGLLDLRFAGISIVKTPYISERLKIIPQKLIDSESDIIAIQEIYKPAHKIFLIEKLKRTYPHIAYANENRKLAINNSLMIFSKYPIESTYIEFFSSNPPGEYLFDSKGFLIVDINVPDFGMLKVCNLHLTAGGPLYAHESKRSILLRHKQLRQVLSKLNKLNNHNVILLGDFNFSQEISSENYRFLQHYGFIDAFNEYNLNHRTNYSFNTWDPKNYLNISTGLFKNSPPQKVDHILFSKEVNKKVSVKNAQVLFQEPIVATGNNGSVTISDHYGLMIELDFKKTQTTKAHTFASPASNTQTKVCK